MTEQLGRCSREDDHTPEEPSDFVPKRLISVSGSKAFLVDGSECRGASARYAALSYCWGGPEAEKHQLKSTTKTLARWQHNIGIDAMPLVLRDAIFLARKLSIQYLWVDALCILQDKEDSSDWDEQCKDVTSIYSNAYVTISAASSTSCTEGFLVQRGPRLRLPFSSARRKWATECFDLQFKWATRLDSSVHGFASALFDDRETCRWRHRGWTYQESGSSTREILFGDSRLYYRCRVMQKAMGASRAVYQSPVRQSIRERGNTGDLYDKWNNLFNWLL